MGGITLKYRKFGKLDWKASVLGFGAMRLPVVEGDHNKIDEVEAIKMMRYAIDHGVNYIDTAYPYHGGNSEIVVGKALKDGYREKVKVATKMPTWLINSQEDMNKFFDEQLTKLQTDQIDFYLLHGLNRDRWFKMLDLNVLDWAEKTIAEGRIGHLGFSFHDEYEIFEDIVNGYRWAVCQILYNYISEEYQAGTKGLNYASSKGLAVIVMEPIAGGMLAIKPLKAIQAIWNEIEIKRTPAEWALQWVWNHPEVTLALSGMSSMEQVVENVQSASRSSPNILTEKELDLISKVREKYLEYGYIGCTGCGYCIPCPEEVSIPEILALYNEYYVKRGDQDAQQKVKNKYDETVPPEKGVEKCVKCLECEEKCPQQLPVSNLITRASRVFGKR